MLEGRKHLEGSIVTMSVFNVHGFRYDLMLGIYGDYDISLIREQFLVLHMLQV